MIAVVVSPIAWRWIIRTRCLGSVTVVPTPEMWEGAKAFGMGAWHWFMLAQPEPLPETLLSGDPRFMIDTTLQKMAHGLDKLHPLALEDYRKAFDSAEVRHWICEDYRAGAGVDEADDLADRADGAFMRRFWSSGNKVDAMAAGGNHSIYGRTGPPMLKAKDWRAGIFCLRPHPVRYWRDWCRFSVNLMPVLL